MKLTKCILDIDQVVMRSPLSNSPHPDWQRAYDNEIIPENVYRFYCCADYFSLDKTLKFLDDQDRMLFHFCTTFSKEYDTPLKKPVNWLI